MTLADTTGVELRYLVEWLQSQAISGLLAIDGDDLWTAHYSLAPGVRETLVEETNPLYSGGMPAIPVAVGRAYPLLESTFRTGAGVAYADYGREAVTAQAALNRPAFVNSLVAEWIPAMPDVQADLSVALASQTSARARVGRRSSWRRRTQGCESTATTTTKSPSPERAATPANTASPTASTSKYGTSRRSPMAPATTW